MNCFCCKIELKIMFFFFVAQVAEAAGHVHGLKTENVPAVF